MKTTANQTSNSITTTRAYKLLEKHIFVHDNFLNNKKQFCSAVDSALNIENSESKIDELMKTVKSPYIDETVNIAIYKLIESVNPNPTSKFVDTLLDKIASQLN